MLHPVHVTAISKVTHIRVILVLSYAGKCLSTTGWPRWQLRRSCRKHKLALMCSSSWLQLRHRYMWQLACGHVAHCRSTSMLSSHCLHVPKNGISLSWYWQSLMVFSALSRAAVSIVCCSIVLRPTAASCAVTQGSMWYCQVCSAVCLTIWCWMLWLFLHRLDWRTEASGMAEVNSRASHLSCYCWTCLQAAQRAITVAREKAANEAKSEFMSLMCHEVRTPLNGCLASAEMLLEMPLQVCMPDRQVMPCIV